MIHLFTDFGTADLYVGQVKAELVRHAPRVPIIDLLHDAPPFRIEACAHLLAALARRFPPGSVVLAVVDPGVGTSRKPVVMRTDECHFVGPDNGLLSVIAARSTDAALWEIIWRPEALSSSFHGRDLFAPIAARLALGIFPSDALKPLAAFDVSLGEADLGEIVYIDHYGNAMTGLQAERVSHDAVLTIAGKAVRHAPVFAAASPGEGFWYENSIGLIEIACNRASAAALCWVSLSVSSSLAARSCSRQAAPPQLRPWSNWRTWPRIHPHCSS